MPVLVQSVSSSTSSSVGGTPDPQQLMTLLNLASNKSQYDLMLSIEKDGSPISGETQRRFADDKPRMEVEGYLWGVSQRSGGGSAGRQPYTLYIVRRCDAATASIMSCLTGASERMTVTLSAYRAGGDHDLDPVLELTVENARLLVHSLLTGPGDLGPCEVLGFAGRRFEVKSAPQEGSGLRGAVRTCSFEATT